jgi:hypothetical protein
MREGMATASLAIIHAIVQNLRDEATDPAARQQLDWVVGQLASRIPEPHVMPVGEYVVASLKVADSSQVPVNDEKYTSVQLTELVARATHKQALKYNAAGGRPSARDERQALVAKWVEDTFGPTTILERIDRLVEEVVELAQAEGTHHQTLHRIIKHVYKRPPGVPSQEVGGIGMCLLAYCATAGISADTCEQAELARVLGVSADVFRQRQNVKADAGIGLRVEEPKKPTT